MTEPLTGIRIGVTAERRGEEFVAALQRKGAAVEHAATIALVPLEDDDELRAATDAVLAAPVDLVVLTTGQGFRGWVSAARAWGVGDRLLARFAEAAVVVRGPKAKGAVRGEGLREEWSSPEETIADLQAYLLDRGVDRQRVAVQLHGTPQPEFTGALTAAGASVIAAQPYRWQRPSDVDSVFRLIDSAIGGRLDAVAFTSAPAAANLLNLAREYGRYDELLAVLRSSVLCACVGPVTAAPLVELGVPVVQPERQRLGALVKLLADVLPARR